MDKLWRFSVPDVGSVQEIVSTARVSPVIAQLLCRRGITDPLAIRSFLDPKLTDLRDPELLPGLSQAADLIHRFIQQGKRFAVYGDYDADGMTAAATLFGCLQLLGADCIYYVPNRLEDGYGLNSEAIRSLHQRGREIVITVDCGVTANEQADLCRQLGMKLIVTDHHQFQLPLPDADAIVHPCLPGTSYPFPGLCGAGVAFKLAWALCQRASNAQRVRPELREYLLNAVGIAAIGTVADVVPLLDENRVLVHYGLRSLLASRLPGIRQLLKKIGLSERKSLSAEDIAFSIAPRLNAAGRLGQAQLGIELLVTQDESRAEALANYIDKLNADRESIERSVLTVANRMAKEQVEREDPPVLVLAQPSWHVGVIGVVAGRIAERYHRPAIVVSIDAAGSKPGIGSGRSPQYVDLHQAVSACKDYLVSCGGHAAAIGLKIEERNLPAFRAALCEYLISESQGLRPSPEIMIDAEAPLDLLDLQTVQMIEQLAPFGAHNPRPVFYAQQVVFAGEPKTMGNNGKHFQAKLKQKNNVFRAVAFGHGEWVEKISELSSPIDIAFRPVLSEFGGFTRIELHLMDWRQCNLDSSSVPVGSPSILTA